MTMQSWMSRFNSAWANAGFECLTDDVREVMGLFLEVLQSPALPEAKIDLYKSQVRQPCSAEINNMLATSLMSVNCHPKPNQS